MANYVTQNGDAFYVEQFPIDWVKTFKEGAASIGITNAAPGAGVTYYAVAGNKGNLFGGAGTFLFIGQDLDSEGNTFGGYSCGTRFIGCDHYSVTNSTTVNDYYVYLNATATLYRKVGETDVTYALGSSTGTTTVAAGHIYLLYAVNASSPSSAAASTLISVQDTATSTNRINVAYASTGGVAWLGATTSGVFKKPIPIPFGYKIVVTNAGGASASYYYIDITL